MFRKVAFNVYPVQDWQRARAFYGETLGLRIGSPRTGSGSGTTCLSE